jgi:hypothetical protein
MHHPCRERELVRCGAVAVDGIAVNGQQFARDMDAGAVGFPIPQDGVFDFADDAVLKVEKRAVPWVGVRADLVGVAARGAGDTLVGGGPR